MIKLKQLLLEAIDGNKVPAEPGKTPIPANTTRLFHYTKRYFLDAIKEEGLKLSSAREKTKDVHNPYGEGYIWATQSYPEEYNRHPIIEFYYHFDSVPKDEVVRLSEDIPPSNFVAIHEPWHNLYRRYGHQQKLIDRVLNGEHDDLYEKYKNSPEHSKYTHEDSVKLIDQIKRDHGKL